MVEGRVVVPNAAGGVAGHMRRLAELVGALEAWLKLRVGEHPSTTVGPVPVRSTS